MNTFVEYIRSIVSGPLLASTVHNAVLEGSTCFGKNRLVLWEKLKAEIGEEEALLKVKKWIDKPYKLKG